MSTETMTPRAGTLVLTPRRGTLRLDPRFGTTKLVEREVQLGSAKLHLGDALDLARALPSSRVHAVICDPPYPRVEHWRSLGSTTRLKVSRSSNNPWFPDGGFGYKRWAEMLMEIDRILVKGGHLFVKCDFHLMERLILLIHKVSKKHGNNLQIQKSLPWDKQAMSTGYGFRHKHEYWLWVIKGDTRRRPADVNNSTPDVFRYKRLKDYPKRSPMHGTISPAQMPIPMAADLVCQTTQPGDLVVDFFAGRAGTIPLTCVALGRHCIASEIVPEYAHNASRRIRLVERNPDKWRRMIQRRQAEHRKGGVPPRIPVLEMATR